VRPVEGSVRCFPINLLGARAAPSSFARDQVLRIPYFAHGRDSCWARTMDVVIAPLHPYVEVAYQIRDVHRLERGKELSVIWVRRRESFDGVAAPEKSTELDFGTPFVTIVINGSILESDRVKPQVPNGAGTYPRRAPRTPQVICVRQSISLSLFGEPRRLTKDNQRRMKVRDSELVP
jgi:hypothetical protein